MSYIISQLDVKELRTNIIYSSENEDDCKAKLLDIIQKTNMYNKVIENDYILAYNLNKGYIYNSKTLKNIYQILKVSEDYDNS